MKHFDGHKFWIKAISPINIALVKYWGKVDSSYIIPANSALSITIDTDAMCSTTTISISKDGPQ